MFVEIRNGAAHVREAADLQSLAVHADSPADLVPGLHGLGEPADGGEHVWLRIDACKAAAAATVPEPDRADWADRFDAMIAYATSKGWTTPDARSVRAHTLFSRT